MAGVFTPKNPRVGIHIYFGPKQKHMVALPCNPTLLAQGWRSKDHFYQEIR
jgi:hypothetical protein